MGFKKGKPVAACIIYKCLLHWGVFEAERTTIFDFIIHTISSILKVRPFSIWLTMWLRFSGYWVQHFPFQTENENDILPYWLANTSALLCMLQRNLRSKGFIMAPSRSSSDTHLSEKANEVSSIPLNLFTFQKWILRLFCTCCLDLRINLSLEISLLLAATSYVGISQYVCTNSRLFSDLWKIWLNETKNIQKLGKSRQMRRMGIWHGSWGYQF